jgi:hypothetical protein
MNPGGFLSTEPLLRLPSRLFLARHRPQDQVAIDPAVPAEDELALAIATGLSPYLGWVFPRQQPEFDRYLTFDGVPDRDRRRWERGLMGFLRKLTWKYGRPLILKSPTHTARVRMLLALFPDARFVHIHRHPVEVFLSTRRLLTKLPPYFSLQWPDRRGLDERILRDYRRMHDAYFAQRDLIPPGQLCEVAYDDLVRDPLGTMATIYRTLGLPGFEQVAPVLRSYLGSLSGYRTNVYPDVPRPLAARIAEEWRPCFEAWGYAPPAGAAPHVAAVSPSARGLSSLS